jgi:DNA-binding IclR family transcriptional regulator
VDNALRLLLLFAEKPRIRLTDASTYLGVATSTAHRLLAMLQYRGFVRQDAASRAYEPGGALTTIAAAVLRQVDVRARARPVLERLNAEFDETVHLGRLDGQMVTFLDSIESSRAVRVASRLGRSLPAHCTSTGKAMLSLLTTDELRHLHPHGPRTRARADPPARVRVEHAGERGGRRLGRRSRHEPRWGQLRDQHLDADHPDVERSTSPARRGARRGEQGADRPPRLTVRMAKPARIMVGW